MYAVIKTGGKQYTVAEGSIIDIERIEQEDDNKDLQFDEVLLVRDENGVNVGKPTVDGAIVNAQIVSQFRGEKIKVFKKIRRHGKQVTKGHRQNLTKVKITEIKA